MGPEPHLFTSRYAGECAACGTTINPGDAIGKVHMARRRIGAYVADDPYTRTCCGPCTMDAAANGDPSMRW